MHVSQTVYFATIRNRKMVQENINTFMCIYISRKGHDRICGHWIEKQGKND